MTRPLALVAAFVVLIQLAPAQERVTGANYPLAQKFNSKFIDQHVQTVNVTPKWVGKTDVFWYAAGTPTGTRYWKVDPAKKEKTPLFDHAVLAAALSEAGKKPLDAGTLQLDQARVSDDGKKLTFVAGQLGYEYDLAAGKLKATGKAAAGSPLSADAIERMRERLGDERTNEMLRQLRDGDGDQKKDGDTAAKGDAPRKKGTTGYKNYAPDEKKYVFAWKHNLYLVEEGQPEDKATQLSTDGTEDHAFATGGGGGFGGFGKGLGKGDGTEAKAAPDAKVRPAVTWAKDSKAFYVTRSDSRGVKELFLVDSIATPRPKLETYKYPMPGEDAIRKTELYYCDVDKKALTKVPPKWRDERYMDVRWGKSPGELRFVRRDRLQRNLEVCALDVFTGKCDCMFGEAFEAANLDFQVARYIDENDEMIWWSERTGWGHFYRYGRDGTFKNALTSGSWRASRIVDVDAKNGYVYFIGNGREPGENPYFHHLYRVKLDGTELTCLDPSLTPDGKPYPGGFNHNPRQSQYSYLSPTKKFVVANSTRVDHAPFATVRDDRGQVVMTLEQTDLTRLKAAGWKMPQTFTVKAADGVTDLYGNMWLPFDFDPKKKYPVVAHVYPGPQTEGVTHVFSVAGASGTNTQLAQLGFVVIQVGHRGGSPERSKAYHSFGYFNLRDYGLVDKKAAIEALAARHSFIDIDRVGIFGHSGGGFMSAAAVLQKPYNEFFKAAVASAGNHDNNIYNNNWSEQYHGMKEVAEGDAKKDAGKGTGTGTGKFGGKGKGVRKGPEAEIEDELVELFGPDDTRSVEELEQRLAELRAKLAALKQAKADEEKAAKSEKAPPPRTAGTTAAAVTTPVPKLKWDIHVPTNAELAANLKGHLLLVHGEIDNNVHPANTMRLVDALIKANKRFDMLIIPGARHGFGAAQPYFTQRMFDFFAEHLLNDRQTDADIHTRDVKRR